MTDKNKNFYITTTLPYVNAKPHVGFAMEIIRADAIARYKKLTGNNVFFNTGTDEHGQKIYDKAVEQGKDIQDYVDEHSQTFRQLRETLNLSEDMHFIRTTDKHHIEAAKMFWKKCEEAGDIYKKNYPVKYCIGCELEKQDSELEDGKCPLHPDKELEIREEENYFFRFSKYQDRLLDLYTKKQDFVLPSSRLNEIKKFVERGLSDFSISRLKSKMSWGVEVPGDSEHVMYVWFDALVNYVSTLGWPHSAEASRGKPNEDLFVKYWVGGETVQYCGKDNLRQQAAMWQAMLMSAGIKNTDYVIVNGFINSGGQKMSKSLGNVISPETLVGEYGTDALRYYLLREVSAFEDGDMTLEHFREVYNANLANGLGNLVSRVMKMAGDNLEEEVAVDNHGYAFLEHEYLFKVIGEYRLDMAMDYIWNKIGELDREIQEAKPWESKDKEVIKNLVLNVYRIGKMLEPFLPDTASKIVEATRNNKKPEQPLFARKD